MATAAAPSIQNKPYLAIALKIGSVSAFMTMATFVKLAGQLPAGQIVFFRSFFAMIPIIAYLLATRQFAGIFKTNNLTGHVMRGGLGVIAMALGFYGLTRLPLPDAIALGYSKPLIMVALGALVLGEAVGRYRWGAVFVGFLGVMIISWPKLEVLRSGSIFADEQAIGVIATLAHALVASYAFVLVRQLVRTERTPTIVLYFSLTASSLALLTIPFGWSALSTNQVIFLVLAGFGGGLGQILLTQSYRYAETSTIAPFEYTSVLFSIGLGIWLFAEIPSWQTLLGSAIVVASGIYIIFRERQLGLKRSAERKTSNMKGL